MSHQLALALAIPLLARTILGAPQATQASFRIIPISGPYYNPGSLVEAMPSVFFAVGGGGPSYVFSLTPKGTTTQIASFPSGILLYNLITASNGLVYGLEYGPTATNVFSVGRSPNTLTSYAPQSIIGNFTQNLPDGTLLGVGLQFSPGSTYLFKSDLQGNITPIYQFP